MDVVDVGPQLGHRQDLGRLPVLPRVLDPPGQHRHRRHRGRAQVDVVVLGPRAPGEVAVERPQRVAVRRRRLAHPHARPAHRLEHPHPALDQLAVHAGLGDRREDLARPGRGGGHDRLVDELPVAVGQDRGRQRQVHVGRVDRRSDADLGELGPGHLLHRHHIVGVVGLGHQRAQLVQVDLHPLVVVRGAILDLDLLEVVLALLRAQPLPRALVGREQG